jgi:hypothetical protein
VPASVPTAPPLCRPVPTDARSRCRPYPIAEDKIFCPLASLHISPSASASPRCTSAGRCRRRATAPRAPEQLRGRRAPPQPHALAGSNASSKPRHQGELPKWPPCPRVPPRHGATPAILRSSCHHHGLLHDSTFLYDPLAAVHGHRYTPVAGFPLPAAAAAVPHRCQPTPTTARHRRHLLELGAVATQLYGPLTDAGDRRSKLPPPFPVCQVALPWRATHGEPRPPPTPQTGSLRHRPAVAADPPTGCRLRLTEFDRCHRPAPCPELPYFSAMGCQPWSSQPIVHSTIFKFSFTLNFNPLNSSNLLKFVENSNNFRKL